MIEVKPKQIRKTRIVCSHCGSENISVRAEVRWDYATQKWVFDDFMEGFDDWCEDCESESSFDETWVYEEPPEWP
jgi:hypothetical protein